MRSSLAGIVLRGLKRILFSPFHSPGFMGVGLHSGMGLETEEIGFGTYISTLDLFGGLLPRLLARGLAK